MTGPQSFDRRAAIGDDFGVAAKSSGKQSLHKQCHRPFVSDDEDRRVERQPIGPATRGRQWSRRGRLPSGYR